MGRGDRRRAGKKLKWAGRAWAKGHLFAGGDQQDEAIADARRWGIDPALIEPALEPGDGVWPENAGAVRAFLAVATQWRMVAGMAGMVATGLDYAGAQAGLALAGIVADEALWDDIRMIEQGAVAALNED